MITTNLLVIKEAPELVKVYKANVQAHAAHAYPYTRGAGMQPVSVATFATEAEAQQAGYHRARDCR